MGRRLAREERWLGELRDERRGVPSDAALARAAGDRSLGPAEEEAASAGGSSPAGDCAEALELALGHVDPEGLATRLTGVPLEPARLDGETAEVDVPGPESPVRLRRERGDWRIAQLRSTATGRLVTRLEAIEPL